MDNDQEVVREPFDDDGDGDQESNQSVGQSPLPNITDRLKRTISQDDCDQEYHIIRNEEERQPHDRSAYVGCENGDDGSSTSSDNSHLEDVKFAETFGINLKSKTSGIAYSKLLKSNQFDSPKSSNPRPIIKTSITSDCIYHKGTFYQKGDIVALCDQDDGQIFFAQLTGFLQDQYCEKSASVNWLVPIRPTSRELFDPSAYRLGLEDMQLRKLDCMTFIRHCPHDYYVGKYFKMNQEQPISENQAVDGQALTRSRCNKDQAYIWTTMDPCRVPSIVPK